MKHNSFFMDERTYKTRLIISFCSITSLIFTTLFFGPIQLTLQNKNDISFSTYDVVLVFGIMSIGLILAGSFLLALIKGKLFDIICSIVSSLALLLFLQLNFLNGNMESLNGENIFWQDKKYVMLINLFVWILLFFAPICINIFQKKLWKPLIVILSIIIVFAQLITIISISFVESNINEDDGLGDYYLTTDNINLVSQDSNIIVIVLDYMDYKYINSVLTEDPHFFDKLEGFTCYTNATSRFSRTLPGANHILTNYSEDAYQVPNNEYINNSWKKTTLLDDLQNARYSVNLYAGLSNYFRDKEVVKKYIANCDASIAKIEYFQLFKNVMKVSLYRYVPLCMKPFFLTYSDDINEGIFKYENRLDNIDSTFINSIDSQKIFDGGKMFKFYHLYGAHPPYNMLADGTFSKVETSLSEQIKGSFTNIFKLISKLKELNVYSKTSIIITADHGDPNLSTETLTVPASICMFYKPKERTTGFMFSKSEVSQDNIAATIVKEAGISNTNYGKSLNDINQDNMVRKYSKIAQDKEYKDSMLYTYEIRGDANKFENWSLVDSEKVKYPFYR